MDREAFKKRIETKRGVELIPLKVKSDGAEFGVVKRNKLLGFATMFESEEIPRTVSFALHLLKRHCLNENGKELKCFVFYPKDGADKFFEIDEKIEEDI